MSVAHIHFSPEELQIVFEKLLLSLNGNADK